MRGLSTLPPDKLTEARDFIQFLSHRYGTKTPEDHEEVWTEEDIRDLSAAVWKYAEEAVPWKEPSGAATRE